MRIVAVFASENNVNITSFLSRKLHLFISIQILYPFYFWILYQINTFLFVAAFFNIILWFLSIFAIFFYITIFLGFIGLFYYLVWNLTVLTDVNDQNTSFYTQLLSEITKYSVQMGRRWCDPNSPIFCFVYKTQTNNFSRNLFSLAEASCSRLVTTVLNESLVNYFLT